MKVGKVKVIDGMWLVYESFDNNIGSGWEFAPTRAVARDIANHARRMGATAVKIVHYVRNDEPKKGGK